jgi:tetratricopeptide (TPR) repeat protein
MARPCGDDELNWIARSEVRLDGLAAHAALGGVGGREAVRAAALDDVEHALALNPTSEFALQQHAHIVSVHFGREADALVDLDRLVKSHPDSARAVIDRGVLLARSGDLTAAVRDVDAALLLDTKPPILYQAACVYALASRTDPDAKREALRYLHSALRAGFGVDVVDADTDLDPLRDDPAFRALVGDAKRLHSAPNAPR